MKPGKPSKATSGNLRPETEPGSGYLGWIQPRGFPGLPPGWMTDWEMVGEDCRLFSATHHPDPWKGHRALVIVHGIGEHGGRYLHFPHYLKDAVDAVHVFDLRGHGRSEGLRGHIERFELFAEDFNRVVRRLDGVLQERFGASDIHVFAHSMGGLIALQALEADRKLPVHSLTLSAPLLGIRVKVPPFKRAAAALLAWTWGSLHLMSELDPHELSHDKEVIEAYVADRLVHRKITPAFFHGMQNAIASISKRQTGIEVPLQILLPMEDRIVECETTERFFKRLKTTEKRLHAYPGYFHEAFNEIGKEKVFEDIKQWIAAHSRKS